MKQLINYDPIFDPAAKTLDFSTMTGSFSLNKLYSVVNVTRNTPIYVPGISGYGVSATNGSKITLVYDTSTHSSTDALNVYYEAAGSIDANAALENGGKLQMIQETLALVLAELRTQNIILAQGLNIDYRDISSIRDDLIVANN